MKLAIEVGDRRSENRGAHSLGRLTDRGLRSYLESQGVKTANLVNPLLEVRAM
jgi:hypothetical protein